MSKTLTSEQLDELFHPSTTTSEMRRRYEMADQMVIDLAHGKRRWTLCVPVREDDPDIVFSAALCDLRAFIEQREAGEKE